MKAFFTILTGLVCLVLLILGNLHWQKKIEVEGNNSVHTTKTGEEEGTEAFVQLDAEQYLSNWSEEEKQHFLNALSENRPYRILVAGSEQIGEGDGSWPVLFKNEMVNTFGEDVVSLEIKSYTETTEEFVTAGLQSEFIEQNADLIIWEPFLLTDNGVVDINITLDHILSVIEEVRATHNNTTFILQPPNPVFQPKLYKIQIEELKKFAEENNILLLDHWTNWPDPGSEQIREYLNEENKPNEEGHRVWAEFLINRFISK